MSDEKRISDRVALLRKAEQIIAGARDKSYGSPEDSFNAIARHWNTYLFGNGASREKLIDAGDVAVMMILLKVARLETGGLRHQDSWLDIAGYAACGYETQHMEKL
jgi:hypothetical protein